MRRRRSKSLLAAIVALACLGSAAATMSQADAKPGHERADQHVVRSGDARFEVLAPTLIRMEYAGDGKFTDAATFNAIGRDDFRPTPYTSRVHDGWLTIDTGRMNLRYKVGSGSFNADNVSLRLRTGNQTVTAHPTIASTPQCTVGTLCEAEHALLAGGVSVASDHTGFTGTGFDDGFSATGATLTYHVVVPTSGNYELRLRYANSLGGDGQDTTRTLSESVDGATPTTITLPTTPSWDDWATATVPSMSLSAGAHTLVVARDADDSGNVNVDSLAVTQPGAAYPAPPSSTTHCPYGTVCQAEAGTLTGGATLASTQNGYAGDGYVGGLTAVGATDTIPVTGVPATGTYQLQVRYANALSSGQTAPSTRTASVTVNGRAQANVSLASTADWNTWSTATVPVRLTKGDNTVAIGCPAADSCHVNLDTVAVTSTRSPILLPHAPLGGYRRSLDLVNGSAPTTPGLLYRDGWYLLDDTQSALWNGKTVTSRPSHDGTMYQDGYLFGYGQDYKQALTDLATLTGPSELLPRWAYGVWYSKYYDYTSADYENTVLPKFRSEGVPLDVLVTDTDYKSPSTWDGWEMDPTKFPDPKAYFAWAKSMGLHTTLNVHPSIEPDDPQFAQAEATAQGKLAPAGTGYGFDWSDPNQLKAYFDLHKTMEQAGVDFWWLDWADSSYASQPGVTPDAWINQQYADDTAKKIGRGFSFSRAYGSGQSGGYSGQSGLPTGPWADKRSTLHFTGDTTSTWQTLQFEVGYTPGESDSTGLSAVSHDIGGFRNDGTQTTGADPGTTKEADDLYARWVQFGAFQPIMRLHGDHSDRLPWQYGDAARTSTEKFLNLREDLVPYTYSLAKQASDTGIPAVRATYLEYPGQQAAYDYANTEYFYGSDVLVAPVTTPGTTATTKVWFPAGSDWTDYFTGKTYRGGTTAQVTSGLDTMPVFVKSGGIVPTRTNNVTNDVQNPLTKVTLTVAGGSDGHYSLYEDNGTDASRSATTSVDYREHGSEHQLSISPARGRFPGQVTQRQWTVQFRNANRPHRVLVNGRSAHWSYDASTRTVTATVPTQSVQRSAVVSYR